MNSQNNDEEFLSDEGRMPKHLKTEDGAARDVRYQADDNGIDPFEPSGAPEVKRVRKKHKKKMSSGKKAALIAVIAVVGALAVAGGAFAYKTYKASQEAHDYQDVSVTAPSDAQVVQYSNGKTIDYNGHTYKLNENMVSMVFMGIDKTQLQEGQSVTGQADAIMVVSLDTSTGAVHVISIPRDSMCEVNTYDANGTSTGIKTMQISLAFNYGDGGNTSADNVRAAASRVLYNIPITYYFALDEEGIGAMCDSIGGVALNALDTIPDTNIVAGQDVILTGDDAFHYVQYRDITQTDSPLARQERQKQFVKAFAQQVLAQTHGSINNLVELYNIAVSYSATNMGADDFSYLALDLVNNGVSDISVTSLTGEMTIGDDGFAQYKLDENAIYQTVIDTYYTQVD